MTTIAVLGLGNMGLPMALNLLKAGHIVRGFDPVKAQVDALAGSGGMACGSAKEAVADADVVVTMLPAGEQVRSVYDADVFGTVPSGTLLIDCSTIDVDSAREVSAQATELGLEMIDAPVSGGVGGAEAGTLTFMVGGPDAAFERAKPFLEVMGKTIVHTGASGNGQAAKICNNMILGISMIAVSEGFAMAENLGLDTKKLFEISSTSSGQCWAMTTYCPVPGLAEAAASNRDFKPGFSAAMMLKDMNLSQAAAESSRSATPLGAEAAKLYADFVENGNGGVDFSAIIRMIRGA